MSTHNICFCGEIRYQHFSDEKSALSVAMPDVYEPCNIVKYTPVFPCKAAPWRAEAPVFVVASTLALPLLIRYEAMSVLG